MALGVIPGVIHVVGTALAGKKDGREWIDLGPTSDLLTERPTEKVLTIEIRDGWMTRRREQVVFAFPKGGDWEVRSSVCPHLGCLVSLDAGKGRFVCPCHVTYFDLNGNLIQGPSPRSLDILPSKVEGDRLYCQWVEYGSGLPEPVKV